jgi:hypothetical protein
VQDCWRVLSIALRCGLLFSGLALGQNLTVIGGSSSQQRLTACIEKITAEELDRPSGSDHSMTIVILERQMFLRVKDSFRAHRTRLAFSNLQTRRMYLSSDVFRDLDTALRCIPHELGHFMTQSVYEDHAEHAARGIRQRAREVCTMPITTVAPQALSSVLKTYPRPMR